MKNFQRCLTSMKIMYELITCFHEFYNYESTKKKITKGPVWHKLAWGTFRKILVFFETSFLKTHFSGWFSESIKVAKKNKRNFFFFPLVPKTRFFQLRVIWVIKLWKNADVTVNTYYQKKGKHFADIKKKISGKKSFYKSGTRSPKLLWTIQIVLEGYNLFWSGTNHFVEGSNNTFLDYI